MTTNHRINMMQTKQLQMIDKYIPLVQGILDENKPKRTEQPGGGRTTKQIPRPTNLVTLMASVLVDAMLSTLNQTKHSKVS